MNIENTKNQTFQFSSYSRRHFGALETHKCDWLGQLLLWNAKTREIQDISFRSTIGGGIVKFENTRNPRYQFSEMCRSFVGTIVMTVNFENLVLCNNQFLHDGYCVLLFCVWVNCMRCVKVGCDWKVYYDIVQKFCW